MPRCLINSVRDYRRGKYHGCFVYDPFVMTTRSGLSINTLPRGSTVINGRKIPSPPDFMREQSQPKKKEVYTKKRSLSYLSLVTRFHLSQRIPELEASPRVFADWKAELFRVEETRLQTPLDSDSDSENEVCIGSVDDSPCTYSQSSDESSSTFDNSQTSTVISSGQDSEIDITGSSQVEANSETKPRILGMKVQQPNSVQGPTKYCVMESINYLQANRLVCTTLGPKLEFSMVNGYAKPASTAVSQDQSKISQTNLQLHPKVVTLRDASSYFLIKPNSQVTQANPPMNEKTKLELERLDEREKYCKNTLQSCPQCGKEFFLFSALQSHIRRHGKSENKCQECGKIFSRSWLLKGHMRTHTGERPFNCPDQECDKAFADKSNLRSHMLIHSTKNKTHVCTKCGRGFAQKRYLHKHMLEVCRLVVS